MKISSWLFSFLGFTFLIIGVIGIFIPLLPTTPFLIFASVCFAKSSERFYKWLINHKIFGPPIQQWQRNKAIAIRYKMLATSMVLVSSVWIFSNSQIPMIGKASYFICMTPLLIFVWTRKSS